jgi:hypothetical protein
LQPNNEFAKGFVKGVMTHWAKIAATPVWLPALNTVAIAGVQAMHVFSALLVLQCFRRQQLRWLFYAMVFHSSFDLLITGIARFHEGLATVVSICGGAMACLYLAIQLRAPAPREQLELALS